LESYIAFDFGPNSDGDGSHGHCDGLSFIFLSKGLEWIVDPGFYALRSGAWRDYFVGTSAHNGIMIEGESAVQASPEYGVFRSAQDFDFHSATVHFVGGSLWQRSLVFLKPDDLLVIDLVLPVEESSITHFQQWHPDARWSERAGGFLLEQAGMSCDVIFARALGSEVITGMEDPIQGWYSVAYGEAKPNYTLIRRETGQTITSCTLFHVYEGTDSIQSFELIEDEGGSSFVFSIERESSQDETIEVWIESGWVERNSSR